MMQKSREVHKFLVLGLCFPFANREKLLAHSTVKRIIPFIPVITFVGYIAGTLPYSFFRLGEITSACGKLILESHRHLNNLL
jgi:hypothetical protein